MLAGQLTRWFSTKASAMKRPIPDRLQMALVLQKALSDQTLLEIARAAIEDKLALMREAGISVPRSNGCVIKELDGTDSSTIRFGPETALRIGLLAIEKHLRKGRA